MRTKKEIRKAINEKEVERKKLPHYSIFGNDNWGTLDEELYILEEVIAGRLDEDDIEDKLDDILEENGGDFAKEEKEKAKLETYDWLLGNIDEF